MKASLEAVDFSARFDGSGGLDTTTSERPFNILAPVLSIVDPIRVLTGIRTSHSQETERWGAYSGSTLVPNESEFIDVLEVVDDILFATAYVSSVSLPPPTYRRSV